MGDIAVDRYKAAVKAITDHWRKKIEGPAKKLLELDGKIAAIQAQKPIPQAAQAQLDAYEKEYKENRAKIEKANLELKLDLSLITPIQETKQNALDVKNLPKFIQTLIKEKGVPIGKNVTIAPDNVSFDFKAMKVKSVGFKITWKF